MSSRIVTATVMFTDLVGSTEQRAALGDDEADALTDEHDNLLRDQITAHGGTVIKSTGDGVLAVFDAAVDGVGAAVEIQRAAAARNEGVDPSHHLMLRIGLSAGDISFRPHDCHGIPVVEAARLEAAAEPGQIWVSDLIRRLVGVRGTFEFVELGPMDLKGLPGPVTVHRAEWEAADGAPAREIDEHARRDTSRAAAQALRVPLPVRLETRGPFVGRDLESTLLAESLANAEEAQHRRVMIVAGEAGIGKTTLASEFARQAHEGGAVVLYGRSDDDLHVPYQPWIEALGFLMVHAPNVVPVASVAGRSAPLRRLLLDESSATVDTATSRDPDTERFLLFEAVVDTLAELSERAPIVLVLDDLHAADGGSLLLLLHVVRAEARLRMLVVGLVRSDFVPDDERVDDALASLYREPGVDRIALEGLDDRGLLDLLEASAGHPLDAEALALRDALMEGTNGNPFFASETLRHLAETGLIGQDADGRWHARSDLWSVGLPPTVRDVIARRVARLGDDVGHLLGLAAVIGRDVDIPLLAAAADIAEDDVIASLEIAMQAALVHPAADDPDRFTFVHALVEKTLYDGLSPARRRRAHRRIAEVLAQSMGDVPDDRIGELAWHSIAADPQSDAALRYTELAAARAESVLAPEDGVRWRETALDLLRRRTPPDEGAVAGALVRLGEVQRSAGDARSRQTLLDAATLARRTGDPALLVRAALSNTRGFASRAGAVDEERVAALREALASIGDDPTSARARLLATLAAELAYESDWHDRRAMSDEALAIARVLGDDATLSYVLGRRANTLWVPDLLDERLATSEENLVVAERLGDPVARFWAAVYRIFNVLMAGDASEVDRHLHVMADLVEEAPVPVLQWELTQQRACIAVMRGDYAEGERLAGDAFVIGTRTGEPDADVIMAGQVFLARLDRGGLDDLADLVRQATVDHPGIAGIRAALAITLCELGRDDEARTMLESEWRSSFREIRYDQLWQTTLLEWAMVAEHVGHAPAAAQIYDLLRPWEAQIAFSGAHVFGSVAYPLGLCAATTGAYGRAIEHYLRAASADEAIGAVAWHARAIAGSARAHATRAEPGDRDAAIEHARRARDLAASVGAAGVVRQADAVLHDAAQD